MMVVTWPQEDAGHEVINWISLIGLYVVLNLMIAVVCIYYASTVIQILRDIPERRDSLARREAYSLFWALVIVCGVANITCLVIYFIFVNIVFMSEISMAPMLIILLVEVISIWIIVKDFKMSDSFFCCSNRHLLRIIHTLAICHILWFLHRVGCGLMISLFFIALAPAQTLAAIAMIFSVIVLTVIYVAFHFYHFRSVQCCTKHSCKIVLKCFVAFIVYFSLIGGSIFLLTIFAKLTKNGFASSVLGSVILSFVALAVIFTIVYLIKRHLKKSFSGTTPSDMPRGTGRIQVTASENAPLIAT